MKNIINIIISSIILIILDLFYLTFIGGPIFKKTIMKIQKEPITINYMGVIITYLLIIILINKFIIYENKTPVEAFILGFCVYGIFDFTNIAIFKNYDYFSGIIDMFWGGILFFITTFLTYKINLIIK